MQQPVIIMMVPPNYQNAQLMHNYNGQLQYNLGAPGKVRFAKVSFPKVVIYRTDQVPQPYPQFAACNFRMPRSRKVFTSTKFDRLTLILLKKRKCC